MTFAEFIEKYHDSPDGDIRVKKAVSVFLSKMYANRISHVWLWDDFPFKSEFADSADSRIDMVAQAHGGEYWLMRCDLDGMSFSVSKLETDSLPSTPSMTLSADDAIKEYIYNSQVDWEIIDRICSVKTKREVRFPGGKPAKPARQPGPPGANPSIVHRCEVCGRKTHDTIRGGEIFCHVCIECRIRRFGSASDEEIADAIFKANELVSIEKIGKRQAIDAILAKEANPGMKGNAAAKKPSQSPRNTGKCRICRSAACNVIGNRARSFHLCDKCCEYYFSDLWSSEGKADRLIAAIGIANEEEISLSLALNVERGRYSLEEAKRRMALKKKGLKGSSTDIYAIGRRMQGSYK